jgi:hypothetical protein
MTSSGLSDFGPGDFREGLEVLLESLEGDSDLDRRGDQDLVSALRRRLVNRLEVEAWYRDHPEIADLAISGPIDINGLPRTGTTALANIMSLDPQFRSLRGWEQARPCPSPTLENEANDPRRLEALQDNAQLSPELKAMHLYNADATVEDTELLGMAFHGQQYTLPVYRYHAWWRAADMTPTYEYHRRVLKLLQSRRPPDLWLLKAPHHNFHLEAIASAYPEVRFIITHRDPAKAVPSWASLVSNIFPSAADERDLHRLGQEVSEHLRTGVEQAMAGRERLGEDRFLDVHHRDLVADPFGVLRRIYEFLKLELSPAVEESVAEWHAENRSGSHGTHNYTPEQFGLTKSQLRSDYAPYIARFDIDVT